MEGDKLKMNAFVGDKILRVTVADKNDNAGNRETQLHRSKVPRGYCQKNQEFPQFFVDQGTCLYIKNNCWGPDSFECVGGSF